MTTAYEYEAQAAQEADKVSSEPLEFFSENVDNWGALEWFERLVRAIREQDKAVVNRNDAKFEICRSVAASSAMTLVRDFEQTIRSQLGGSRHESTTDWVQCPICDEPDMQRETDQEGHALIHCANHDCASNGAHSHPSSDAAEIERLTNELRVEQEKVTYERERTEAAEDALAEERAKVERLNRIATDRSYIILAYRQMLGPKGQKVADMWDRQGVLRQHTSWGPGAGEMTGEERAQLHLDTDAMPKRELSPGELDGEPATLSREEADNDRA